MTYLEKKNSLYLQFFSYFDNQIFFSKSKTFSNDVYVIFYFGRSFFFIQFLGRTARFSTILPCSEQLSQMTKMFFRGQTHSFHLICLYNRIQISFTVQHSLQSIVDKLYSFGDRNHIWYELTSTSFATTEALFCFSVFFLTLSMILLQMNTESQFLERLSFPFQLSAT